VVEVVRRILKNIRKRVFEVKRYFSPKVIKDRRNFKRRMKKADTVIYNLTPLYKAGEISRAKDEKVMREIYEFLEEKMKEPKELDFIMDEYIDGEIKDLKKEIRKYKKSKNRIELKKLMKQNYEKHGTFVPPRVEIPPDINPFF
jgi:C-terminal processing protease CtpA/Prc